MLRTQALLSVYWEPEDRFDRQIRWVTLTVPVLAEGVVSYLTNNLV